MKFFIIFLSFTFVGCKPKQNFELEIQTKQVNYLDVENYKDYFSGEKNPPRESLTNCRI
ncbi:hypothetical protein R1T16_12445 [Flavobacterium sp. DG1-102-2]|uniref:hypothetical protein n=1 Tax=Flavobacterium sp. DG1-102-2 TaxID=3081663 RepID=UPI002949111D|nr:hypothetical protein [Flavobacterium sp. DG1-102-2]MDV6169236.1 hypothetical protein [Flavobacterium sp. DG1-102-2]